MKEIKKKRLYGIAGVLFALLLCVLLPVSGNAADVTPGFAKAVEKQTTAPEGYAAVTTVEELAALASQPDGKFILMSDLDLTSKTDWTSIPVFSGIFDGNGYAVKGLKLPLFGSLTGATVKNLALTDVNVDAAGHAGALTDTLNAADTQTGCTISNVYVTGAVHGTGVTAGVIGYDAAGNNVIEDTANYAAVTSDGGCVGGIVGQKDKASVSSYRNCCNYGSVTGKGNEIGGIVGSAYAEDHTLAVFGCRNMGNITGVNEIGGIAGYLSLKSSAANASLDFSNLANSGTVKGNGKVGGLAGYLYLEDEAADYDARAAILQSSNVGMIDCTGSYSGGLVGYVKIPGASGAPKAVRIENCFNAGMLKNGGNMVGRAALASGTVQIEKCLGVQEYNTSAYGMIYSAKLADGGTSGSCRLSDCYYYSANGAYAYKGTGCMSGTASLLTKNQAKKAASYPNFDFSGIWVLDAAKNGGYPYLKDTALLEKQYKAPAAGTVLTDHSTGGIYRVTEEGFSVSYDGTTNTEASSVTIPSKIEMDGYTYCVTAVTKRAFKGNKTLKKITIPKTVTKIGCGAFNGCSSLTTVTGCKGVTYVYKYAFYKCSRLTTIGYSSGSVFLPSVVRIGKKSFYMCTSLKKVYLTSLDLTAINAQAFRKCTGMTKFSELSEKLSVIQSKAFYNCTRLKTLKLCSKSLTAANTGSYALKNIKANAVFSVPSGKVAEYQNLFLSKGAKKTISVKKI